jgi:hypothetical protein
MNTDPKSVIEQAANIKPSKLYMKDIKWKYLVRSALRGKNILIVGPSGPVRRLPFNVLLMPLVAVTSTSISTWVLLKTLVPR